MARRKNQPDVAQSMYKALVDLQAAEIAHTRAEGRPTYRRTPVVYDANFRLTVASRAEAHRAMEERRSVTHATAQQCSQLRKVISDLVPTWVRRAAKCNVDESPILELTMSWGRILRSHPHLLRSAVIVSKKVLLRSDDLPEDQRVASNGGPSKRRRRAPLSHLHRDTLQALIEHDCLRESVNLPNQQQVAEWVGVKWNSHFKSQLSLLVRLKLIGNRRHEGERGGYFLTAKGRRAFGQG
jgi:hypothetical protein